jgi:NADH-quinone oxidoreductase subunit N
MNTLIALSALGLTTLFSEIFGFKKIIRPLVLAGLSVALFFSVCDYGDAQSLFNNMITIDRFSASFAVVLIGLALLWTLLSADFFKDESNKVDHLALVVFALTGAVCMVQFSNMIMLFLGIEILSVSLYVLSGSRKSDLSSNESALKYFLMGAFATGFLLFGMALVYGGTGSFDLQQVSIALQGGASTGSLVHAGILLLLIGMSFKISAAPFHFWAPDVYQGAPTQVTAFMASVVKTAAIAAFLRLFTLGFSEQPGMWAPTLWAISALTILIGNIAAAAQKNVKRMLAYSSIAHAGYMLLAVLAGNKGAATPLLFYTVSYGVSSLLSFYILLTISNKTGTDCRFHAVLGGHSPDRRVLCKVFCLHGSTRCRLYRLGTYCRSRLFNRGLLLFPPPNGCFWSRTRGPFS